MPFLMLSVVIISASPDAGSQARGGADAGWSMVSGGVSVRWVNDRLLAEWDGGTRVVEAITPPDRGCVAGGLDSRAFSMVGSLLSWQTISSADCGGAHPGCGSVFRTVDLLTGREVELASLFGERSVLNALRRDRFVRNVTADGGSPPPTFEGLRQALLLQRNLQLSRSSFHFHHLEDAGVAVRVVLMEGAHAVCGEVVELGLVFPVPPSMSEALRRAAQSQEGFLSEARPKSARWGKVLAR